MKQATTYSGYILPRMMELYIEESHNAEELARKLKTLKKSVELVEQFCKAAQEGNKRGCFEVMLAMTSIKA
jgi:hypothetical protein